MANSGEIKLDSGR